MDLPGGTQYIGSMDVYRIAQRMQMQAERIQMQAIPAFRNAGGALASSNRQRARRSLE
jgi:hypothetical protein